MKYKEGTIIIFSKGYNFIITSLNNTIYNGKTVTHTYSYDDKWPIKFFQQNGYRFKVLNIFRMED